ncbi:MAG TPA: type I-E CRISPR-associated protein Cas5/CasD [Desulfatiglandales bacterium]|nr:type I-E CRISPR-associated protein Cas5/CasD [Desulfatiglandales bacterium]
MRDYLVFQLYGPFVSWGEIAVGEERPSALIPTKSAILGILAAAQGIKRPDTVRNDDDRKVCENQHVQMSQGYGIAVKTVAAGMTLFDYHTVQVPSSGIGRNKKIFYTRRDELCWGDKSSLNTTLSRREYRQDAYYTVAIWARSGAPFPLDKICGKLLEPEYMLYLGRKACPPALPLNPRVVSSSNIEDALAQIALPEEIKSSFDRVLQDRSIITWDTDAETQMKPTQTVERRDGVLSRLRWQFSVRSEHQTVVEVIHAE